MHRYEKLTFEAIESCDLPNLHSHVVECPKCRWCHPVPNEYTDWKEVADRYQKGYRDLVRHIDKQLREAGEAFDVPLIEYFEAGKQELIDSLKAIIERLDEGKR